MRLATKVFKRCVEVCIQGKPTIESVQAYNGIFSYLQETTFLQKIIVLLNKSAPHSSSLGILIFLRGATLDLAMIRLVRIEPSRQITQR